MASGSLSIQLIDGDGAFNAPGLDDFAKAVKLAESGVSYAVVSIMGPQSSGKSTLLNQLFCTNFREMIAHAGRSQTTRGIWLAQCAGIDPFTLVLDLEGSDGRERGEDDTAFEKQTALFALAVSDIVLINTWCIELGREQASNKPLLRTVFQVMLRLFSPRKTTLLFVIRDKTRTPLQNLERLLREDIQKIWDAIPKPEAHKETPLSEFFVVEVVALSNYEHREEEFKEQVSNLRQRFFHSIAPGGLAGDRRGVVPASGFSFSVQQIWKIIKENKDLDLPAHKIMVATVRCEEIAKEKLACFTADESWCELEENVQVGLVSGFGKRLSSILGSWLSRYDMEAVYFDDSVRTAKRQQLESKLLQIAYPAYQSTLSHLRAKTLDDFKEAFEKLLNKGEGFAAASRNCTKSFLTKFDEGCAEAAVEQASWESSKVREKLRRDIDMHVATVRASKLSELTASYEGRLSKALAEPVEALLDSASSDTWPAIRKLLRRESEFALAEFSSSLSNFDLDRETEEKLLTAMEDYARNIVESKAKEEAARILIRMKDRFSTLFSRDSDSMPRVWTGKEDIGAITKVARTASLKLLSVMAAIRLDEGADNIENTLSLALLDTAKANATDRSIVPIDPLASSSWETVPPAKTLITPVQCKSFWRKFMAETEESVTQATAAQNMVATVRCEEIANEKLASFTADKSWHELEKSAYYGVVPDFGQRLNSILKSWLSRYDEEAVYFDGGVRTAKRQYLESKILENANRTYQCMLPHIRAKTLEDFKEAFEPFLKKGGKFSKDDFESWTGHFLSAFDEGCARAAVEGTSWELSQLRDQLFHEMSDHVVNRAKLLKRRAAEKGKAIRAGISLGMFACSLLTGDFGGAYEHGKELLLDNGGEP